MQKNASARLRIPWLMDSLQEALFIFLASSPLKIVTAALNPLMTTRYNTRYSFGKFESDNVKRPKLKKDSFSAYHMSRHCKIVDEVFKSHGDKSNTED